MDHEINILPAMLQDRGYTQVRMLAQGSDPRLVVTCKNSAVALTHVHTTKESNKVGVRLFRRVCIEGLTAGAGHLIFITQDGLTPFATREQIEEQANLDIEIWKKQELCMPILQHTLVPQHIPLSPAEKRRLLQTLCCKGSALPKMKALDAVAKWLHLQPGTVIKIMRSIRSLKPEHYYRIVVLKKGSTFCSTAANF